MKQKIVILSTDGKSLPIAYHTLKDAVDIQQVVIEENMSKKQMINYRVKVLGWPTVIGQLAFIACSKFIGRFSQSRYDEIIKDNDVNNSPIPVEKIVHVKSVNTVACRKILKASGADFILVNGTRIIGKKTLNSVKVPFVNIHAGITPKYRGVHGGYWALASRDAENCGVTLHYVDTGVDTGGIIAQGIISPTKQDSYATYPLLQQILGLQLVKENLSIIGEKSGTERDDLVSKQWFHPTLWQYIINYLKWGVK